MTHHLGTATITIRQFGNQFTATVQLPNRHTSIGILIKAKTPEAALNAFLASYAHKLPAEYQAAMEAAG